MTRCAIVKSGGWRRLEAGDAELGTINMEEMVEDMMEMEEMMEIEEMVEVEEMIEMEEIVEMVEMVEVEEMMEMEEMVELEEMMEESGDAAAGTINMDYMVEDMVEM